MKPNTEAQQSEPFEDRLLFTLEHRGTLRHPTATRETISLAEIGRRFESGKLSQFTYVSGPGAMGITVEALLQRAKAGLLSDALIEVPEAPQVKAKVSLKDLKGALEICLSSNADLKKHTTLLNGSGSGHKQSASVCDELHQLETTADLTKPEVLSRISQLRTMAETLPHRTQLCSQSHNRNLKALLDCNNGFITDQLRPRLAELESRARATVLPRIKDHVAPDELEFCITRSALVSPIKLAQDRAVIRTVTDHEAAIELAQESLGIWDFCTDYERKNLS